MSVVKCDVSVCGVCGAGCGAWAEYGVWSEFDDIVRCVEYGVLHINRSTLQRVLYRSTEINKAKQQLRESPINIASDFFKICAMCDIKVNPSAASDDPPEHRNEDVYVLPKHSFVRNTTGHQHDCVFRERHSRHHIDGNRELERMG